MAMFRAILAVVGLFLVTAVSAVCPITPADVPVCDQPDAFYTSKQCDVPRLYDSTTSFEDACASVQKIMSEMTRCDLRAKLVDITNITMQAGCMMTNGDYVTKSSTIKVLFNSIEGECHFTGKFFNEAIEEGGFLATDASCPVSTVRAATKKATAGTHASSIRNSLMKSGVKNAAAAGAAIRKVSAENAAKKAVELKGIVSSRSYCSGNYCNTMEGCDYHNPEEGLTLCCPSNCYNTGVLEFACCTIHELWDTCMLTRYWLLPYGMC